MLPVLLQHMHVDSYGKSTVSSIYFDTADMRLIRASIEHPIYKEKLRLRCYGTPSAESNAFIELKKKYKGVVYKRRIEMPYADAMEFLCGDAPCPDKQIAREIDYALRFYPELRPSFGIFANALPMRKTASGFETDNRRKSALQNAQPRSVKRHVRRPHSARRQMHNGA